MDFRCSWCFALSVILIRLDLFLGGSTKHELKRDMACSELLPGQYKCSPPIIDKKTQQPKNCSLETLTARVECKPAPGIHCNGKLFTGHEVGFEKEVPCNFVSGYRFDSVLILSVFGGIFGLDRFYLGYPALACLKVATVGGFGLWYLWDIFFIATGTVVPADGSSFYYPYYDPPVTLLRNSNVTFHAG
ncbi:TM2 domain containing protein 1 [Fasciola gigantica]|uniref:TM2 domain containing protein 1 n=1 Tax=Fasciola gigantica TaxID=46835 RepID=A0A504WUT4_FASGI|nr:TM2 domain containing protein 1 [Fasciola gigantica]